MRTPRDIIYLFGTHNWDWVRRRPEHLAETLAKKGCRVLFVETPFDFDLKNLNYKDIFARSNREIVSERLGKGRIVQAQQNLWIYKTPFVMPRKIAFLRSLNILLIKHAVKKIAKRLHFDHPILLLGDHRGMEFIGAFGESLVCWDSVDEEAEFASDSAGKQYLSDRVKALSLKTNVLFVTSRRLYENKRSLNAKTYLVPNAVDYAWYTSRERQDVPDELAAITKPVLGCIGYIDSWVDTELLLYVARHNPSWNIVMVGPSRVDAAELRALKNVHFIDRKDYRDMPRYIRYFDVCLIPFKVNALTDAVNPVKVYEYLAAGKPVVSTDFEEMRSFKDVVYVAPNKEEFVAAVEKIVQEKCADDAHVRRMRQEFAAGNTWDDRADAMLSVFEKEVG